MLVDIEYTSRKNNRLIRLIRNAGLEQSDASIADIDYSHGRKLNKNLIQNLATCDYISNTETFSLLEPQEVVKHIWRLPLVWKPANSTIL